MNALRLSLYFLLTGSVLMAEPTAVTVPPLISVDPLTEALPVLRAKYIDFKSLNNKPGDHLGDLVARSKGGIVLDNTDPQVTAAPLVTASLSDNILYWRLASFALPVGTNWSDLAAQSHVAQGVILDLRSNTMPDDYKGATQLLGLFNRVGLTRVTPITILTNHQTSGAAEALAGCLQSEGAIVIGRETAGRVAVFETMKLSSGQVLRYAVAGEGTTDLNPLLAFKTSSNFPVWDRPVLPDISVKVDDWTERAALTLIKDNHILDVIQESAGRHRMNEASLVQGQDPEWDDYLASLESKAHEHFLLSLPPIHDTALVSALDSLKAIRLSQRPAPSQPRTDASTPVSSSVQ